MKNERGLTLVELLAVLALVGILMTLLTTIFLSSIKASDRNIINQKLQQEGNYITEVVRNEYLKSSGNVPEQITFEIVSDKLLMNGNILSEGYSFSEVTSKITETNSLEFKLTIEKDGKLYTIDTVFSKLN